MTDPEGPDSDEMVIFDPVQILPRYLCYYTVTSDEDVQIIVLWVGLLPPNSQINKILESDIVKLKSFSNTPELQKWFQSCPPEIKNKSVRIISNKFHEGYGDEVAGERLCQWVKDPNSGWQHCPCLLFGDSAGVQLKPNVKKGLWISNNVEELVVFAMAPVIPKKLNK